METPGTARFGLLEVRDPWGWRAVGPWVLSLHIRLGFRVLGLRVSGLG